MAQTKLGIFLQSTGFLDAQQAADVAGSFVPKTLRRHEVLLPAGQVCSEYLLLESGLLRAFAHTPAGNEVTTGFYTSGQVAFEVASFFQRVPSQETLQALTDCAGWSLSHARMNELFHARSEFREFGRAMLVQGFAALKGRMLATITEPAALRYERLLQTQPTVAQHAPLKHVASYLGITDSSLSRIRKGATAG